MYNVCKYGCTYSLWNLCCIRDHMVFYGLVAYRKANFDIFECIKARNRTLKTHVILIGRLDELN